MASTPYTSVFEVPDCNWHNVTVENHISHPPSIPPYSRPSQPIRGFVQYITPSNNVQNPIVFVSGNSSVIPSTRNTRSSATSRQYEPPCASSSAQLSCDSITRPIDRDFDATENSNHASIAFEHYNFPSIPPPTFHTQRSVTFTQYETPAPSSSVLPSHDLITRRPTDSNRLSHNAGTSIHGSVSFEQYKPACALFSAPLSCGGISSLPIKRTRGHSGSVDDTVGSLRSKRSRLSMPPYSPLSQNYEKRKAATACFPPRITSGNIKSAMRNYETVIKGASAAVETSCACCGEFLSRSALDTLASDDSRLVSMPSAESTLHLDDCSLEGGFYRFCRPCLNALLQFKVPKFSSLNSANVTMCQHYPDELKDLTLIEESVIARSHPIGAILKLKNNGIANPAAYNAIRGHIVTIPQNPGPLLDILPSPDLRFHEHIRIVWSGKSEPTIDDLKPFAEIRKEKVFRALLWLCEHNSLYKSVTINHDLLDRWEETFVPAILQDNMISIPEALDSADRGTYAGDMDGFAENDLQTALDDMADNTIGSGAVYSDIEGHRMNPELKMIAALTQMLEVSNDTGGDCLQQIPVVNWTSRAEQILMNDFDNPEFFTGAFPTLFPYGIGGHLVDSSRRNIPISLQAWAKWLMNHHSRRFARHPTFMYLLYDVIQRRKSALGNSLLVKRGDYERVRNVISSLTYSQLLEAADSLRSTQKISDPAIAILRRAVQMVGALVPNSSALKHEMRELIRALLVEFGPAAFWLTLNPSDLRDLLVLKLAGILIPTERLRRSNSAFQKTIAVMNPAAIAKFFDSVCKAIFNALIRPDGDEMGIFGHVSTYFGVVETNGRGMLHLHCLVWLTGNVDFFNLRHKMLHDSVFADRMLEYLDTIILECVRPYEPVENQQSSSIPSTFDFNDDHCYTEALYKYGNAVAAKRQMHSQSHNPTCFKYCKKGTRECRFSFPRPLIDQSYVDDLGVIHLHRDNSWVNPYNPCLAAVLDSNHDLSFLATKAKTLALLYYITNYATKDEASTYQMVTSAAILRRALEDAEQAPDPNHNERAALNKGMSKFCLRVFNRMSHDREISGVQVASSLLQLPTYYTPDTEVMRINLYYLRRRFPSIVREFTGNYGGDEEQISISTSSSVSSSVSTSIFDDYRWRGPDLNHLCLYEYVKIIQKRPAKYRTSTDIDFDADHPEYGRKTQRFYDSKSKRRTVALVGSLSDHQEDEDHIVGGHPETFARDNDLSVILLALFVCWQDLPLLFSHATTTLNQDSSWDCDLDLLNFSSVVWTTAKHSLPEYIQDLARNVQLLRKSKEDAEIDMMERNMTNSVTASTFVADSEMTSTFMIDMNLNVQNSDVLPTECVDNDTLRLSYYLVRQNWIKDCRDIAADIPALYQPSDVLTTLPHQYFTSFRLHTAPSFHADITADTLKVWSDLFKNPRSASSDNNTVEETHRSAADPSFSDNDEESVVENEFEALVPVLHFTDIGTSSSMSDIISRVGSNPTPLHLVALIREILPLNSKQSRVTTMIFHHVLRYHSPFIAEKDDQFLLYVGGEGGTGKSRIIEAVRLGMDLLQRRDELLVTAPTGNAAKNIRGSTIHTSFDIPVHGRKQQASTRVRSLWRNTSILVIDEISMVSSKLLNSIDKQCNRLKNLDANSTAVFGGLPVVILLGDFHQFPPIRAKALWQKQDHEDETRGRQLWEMFTNVVCLGEQMRQQDDARYYDLLTRARNGTLTQDDVDLLNTRVVNELEMRSDRCNICIVRSNKLRHVVNRTQTERFTRLREQRIFIFPSTHKRWKNADGSHNIDLDKLFQIQDGSEVKGPGFLLYTKDMPTMVLSNISTPLGIVNGALGKAIGIIPDPNTEMCDLDDIYTLCSHPPLCVLFEPIDGINTTFPGLEQNVFPIFACNSSLSVQNMSISRSQIPITPAWAITDYKIQGSTCEAVTLDLHRQCNSSNRASSHRRYCSIYVQLSRVRSLQGLSLLQPITIDDLNCKPDSLLRVEDERIALLEKRTDVAWTVIESTFS